MYTHTDRHTHYESQHQQNSIRFFLFLIARLTYDLFIDYRLAHWTIDCAATPRVVNLSDIVSKLRQRDNKII
jgi:hypothetical protein